MEDYHMDIIDFHLNPYPDDIDNERFIAEGRNLYSMTLCSVTINNVPEFVEHIKDCMSFWNLYKEINGNICIYGKTYETCQLLFTDSNDSYHGVAVEIYVC